ncbi:MAG: hypothetical protein FWG11_05785, partial [Promicromonosporaceae bacterium]|nr:hypothetical protein [Promicromonosporaceae bacterium]
MNVTGIVPALLADPGFAAAIGDVRARGEVEVRASVGVRAPLLVEASAQRPLVVVTASGRAADDLAAALRAYLPDEQYESVAVLPAWETLPHERLSPRADTVARRLAVFRRLAHPELSPVEEPHSPPVGEATSPPVEEPRSGVSKPSGIDVVSSASTDGHAADVVSSASTDGRGPIRILVMPTRSLLQPVVKGLGDLGPVALQTGDSADLTEVAQALVAAAYTRVDMVERRGEFAVRGGILDVFAPTDPHPLRLEFWGDEVTEIRWFSVADQRSLEIAAAGLWAPPCREILLTDAVRRRARELIPSLPGATDLLDKLAEGIAAEGMESLAPLLVDEMVPVLDLVPDDALLVIDEPERVRRRAHDLVATTQGFLEAAWIGASAGGTAPLPSLEDAGRATPTRSDRGAASLDLSAASFASLEEARALASLRGLGWWTLTSFGMDHPAVPPVEEAASPLVEEPRSGVSKPSGFDVVSSASIDGHAADRVSSASTAGRVHLIGTRDVTNFRGDFQGALDRIRQLQGQSWRLIMTTEGPGPARRMVEQLGAEGTPARLVASITAPIDGAGASSGHGLGPGGFVAADGAAPPAALDDVAVTPAAPAAGAEPGVASAPSWLEPGVVLVTPAMVGKGFVAPGLKLAVFSEADLTGRAGPSTK